MSMTSWGVVMYGIYEDDLNFKKPFKTIRDIFIENYNGENETTVEINNKNICISHEYLEDSQQEVLGFYAGFPWEEGMQGITRKDVENAIVKVLSPYVIDSKRKIIQNICYINTVNYG